MSSRLQNRLVHLIYIILLIVIVLSKSDPLPGQIDERIRFFTQPYEFNFVSWTMNALGVKAGQAAVGAQRYLPEEQRKTLVLNYLELVSEIQLAEAQLDDVYSDPYITDPQAASVDIRTHLERMYTRRRLTGPLAEAIIQEQVGEAATQMGLTFGGQPVPPVLFHSTHLPWALIVSPRDSIRQEVDISLKPELTVDQHVALEAQVDEAWNVSSLVVAIGGIGLYPTMVQYTSDMTWLAEVVAHEWIHNYLTLRPLGMSYLNSPELRTMNETTAAIAGKEIGRLLLENNYPELLPPAPATETQLNETPASPPTPPAFDFVKEMRETRVTVDRLLAEGKIKEAEAYMEMRRRVFWDNGYHLRKLNQAYFAFYGAYADQPGGGAAGEDPVGAAVRLLRQQSPTLKAFIERIAWMSSFEQLQRAVQ